MVEEFYAFMRERESIRIRRSVGMPRQLWTEDWILQTFKFTNVKREHDRTTQNLVRHFYRKGAWGRQLLINCAMARFFGLYETVNDIGWRNTWTVEDRDHIAGVVKSRYANREKVFTSAYIVPNCGEAKPKDEVVIDVVSAVATWAQENADWFMAPHERRSWQWMIESLCKSVRGMGSFMAKEVVLDYILFSEWTPYDWHQWTPVGPGARRGAARVQGDGSLLSPLSERESLKVIKAVFVHAELLWHDRSLWAQDVSSVTPVDLSITDIQFQFCEFDKYSRAKRKEGRPKTNFVPFSEDAK